MAAGAASVRGSLLHKSRPAANADIVWLVGRTALEELAHARDVGPKRVGSAARTSVRAWEGAQGQLPPEAEWKAALAGLEQVGVSAKTSSDSAAGGTPLADQLATSRWCLHSVGGVTS